MKKIAVIGAGISGLSVAQMLKDKFDVTVFELSAQVGGMIKCENIDGNLYHKVGGHVFNSKIPEVLDWFWKHFDREKEFIPARRNAKIWLNNQIVGYPIENYLYQLPEDIASKIIAELLEISKKEKTTKLSFGQFLIDTFGQTLYNIYFEPYNQKIWQTPLNEIPLDWLDGKLPMPEIEQILLSNILRKEEQNMVHAKFYYPSQNGSQFIADRFTQNLNIRLSTEIISIDKTENQFILSTKNETETFDYIIYTGDVRKLPSILMSVKLKSNQNIEQLSSFKSHSTSNLLCTTNPTDLSWLYFPDKKIAAHRIIFTGNFSPSNNATSNQISCVIEFSGKHSFVQMCAELTKLPLPLHPITGNYHQNSYVIQDNNTRTIINSIKLDLEPQGFFLSGRFAEWEYYNMDKCMESAMKAAHKIESIVNC